MKIHIVTPVASTVRTGNYQTADQWASVLRELGHEVEINADISDSPILIALHALKSHEIILQFHKNRPENSKLIVALTGTDIYPEPDDKALESIAVADQIVIYQSKAIERVPPEFRDKTHVILQSAEPAENPPEPNSEYFDICVIGHLRDVKDPLRAAAASRLLPASSKIRILHAGGILDEKYRERVEREQKENPRYRYLGELDQTDIAKLIASSRVMVLSSFSEGGGRVISEAFVNRTPVISSKIDCMIGLAGEDYPGFFPVGDTTALAEKMQCFENDANFRNEMKCMAKKLLPKFQPKKEKEAWRKLLAEY